MQEFTFKRIGGIATTNVPHLIVRHSPTGLEWGYGGSGPADTALNILAIVTGIEPETAMYQAFKGEVIQNIPKSGGTITREQVEKWIDNYRARRQ